MLKVIILAIKDVARAKNCNAEDKKLVHLVTLTILKF